MSASAVFYPETVKLSRTVWADFAQSAVFFHIKGKLSQSFVGRNDCSVKSVFVKPRKRTCVVGVRVREEYGVEAFDLLFRQAWVRVEGSVSHFSAVHKEADLLSPHIKAVPAVLAHAAGKKNLHVTLPSAFRQGG